MRDSHMATLPERRFLEEVALVADIDGGCGG